MILRVYADDNIGIRSIAALEAAGHDVFRTQERSAGLLDERHLAEARQSVRVVITNDTDFGDLIFRDGHAPPAGIVLLRLGNVAADARAARMMEALDFLGPDVLGSFSLVTMKLLKPRPFPER